MAQEPRQLAASIGERPVTLDTIGALIDHLQEVIRLFDLMLEHEATEELSQDTMACFSYLFWKIHRDLQNGVLDLHRREWDEIERQKTLAESA